MRTFRITTPEGFAVAFRAAWDIVRASPFGSGWELVIQPLKSKRSLAQNRRWHAMLSQIAETAWLDGRQFSKDAWMEWFKIEFIGWVDIPGGGKIGLSTTGLSVEEFGDFMTKVEQWCAENGYPLDW